MNEQLKPCPCGFEAKLIYVRGESYGLHLGEKYTSIKCSCCSFSANDVDDWNTRADGWIGVEDELPLENGFVIARSTGITDSVHYTGTLILYFSKAHPKGQQFHSSSRITPVTCTHWMPLPNPPKAVSCGE